MTLTLVPIAIVAVTPLLLAVFGELVLERAGLINIGLEGMILSAALSASITATMSGSLIVGLLGGILGALIVGVLFGVLSIHLRADQIVVGAALNFTALGVTGVVYRELIRDQAAGIAPPAIGRWEAPLLVDIPLIGPLLFRYDPIVAFAWVVVPILVTYFLLRTRTGLRLRACGENPSAVAAAGFSVARYRWLALAVQIVLAGIAGAYLAVGLSPGFAENMVAGRGFIALAIVVFARWEPRGVIAGAIVFGVTAAAQYALQAAHEGFAFHLLLAMPYVITLLALALFSRTIRPPEALGKAE